MLNINIRIIGGIMKIKFKNIFSLKSLFSRLMFSFLIIIFIASMFHFFSYKLYKNYIEKELINNSYQRMEVLANKLDSSFQQVQNTLLKVYMEEEFKPISNNENLTSYQEKCIVDRLKSYANFNSNVKTIFILNEKSNLILTSDGSYDRRKFFNTFYNNYLYNEEFWLKERNKNFYTGYYETVEFVDSSDPRQDTKRLLMPIAFKQVNYSNFVMVALVDINSITMSNENEFLEDFYIYDKNNQLIYLTSKDNSMTFKPENLKGVDKNAQGYIFSRKSKAEGITYVKFLPNGEIKRLMVKVNIMFSLMIIGSVLVSFVISYIISRKVNRPVAKIINTIEEISQQNINSENEEDLQFIRNNVQKIISENFDYNREIKKKNSLLETLFYHSKIKNVYLHLNEMIDEITVKEDYSLVCFRIHFKDKYYEEVAIEHGKSTYALMELIKMHMKEYVDSISAFQSQNNEFIIIIEMIDKNLNIKEAVEKTLSALKEDEQYIFFTAAISNIYSDISQFDKCYSNLSDVIKYRLPIGINQVLEENKLAEKAEKFYLPHKQIEQFTELLCSGKRDECIKRIHEIFEQNAKGKVNQFYINLICSEIINCCITAANNEEGEVGNSLNINLIQEKLNTCCTIEQYEKLCIRIIDDTIEKFIAKERKKDYVIDFIKEYIESHYNEDLYLELFAEKLNLTKEYISLYFKNKTGVNLINYLNEYRVERAKELLMKTELSINEIAQRVGYNAANNFSRIFKQYTGRSPREYRQNTNI